MIIKQKTITQLSIAIITIGIITLLFNLNFEPDDAFYETNNEYVKLTGKVLTTTPKTATIQTCRNITIITQELKKEDIVILEGSMFKGIFNPKKIQLINSN